MSRCCCEFSRVLALIFLMLMPVAASAQYSSAIEGTVTDPSGAVVAGAEVTVTNVDLGVHRATASNTSGYFRIGELAPGNYRMEVKLSGFKAWIQADLLLDARQVRTVTPVIEVGDVTTEVSVRAEISAVNTATAVTGRQLDKEALKDAPLPGRAVWRQAALVPGVVGTGETSGSQGGGITSGGAVDNFEPQLGLRVFAAGQRQDSNQFLVDGSYVNEDSRAGSTFVSPNPDALEAFHVRANEFSAAKGRTSGVFFETVTKSGTNKWHGSLAWWHTNNKLQSRTITDRTLPVFRRNEGWVTGGGPIVKNRTFVFGSFDVLRSSDAFSAVDTVETSQFRSYVKNNFPNTFAAQLFGLEPAASDPATNIQTVAQLKQRTPGSFPAPPIPDDLPAVGTIFVSTTRPRVGEQYTVRIDHHFNKTKDRLFAFFYRTHSQTVLSASNFIRPDITQPSPATNYFGKAQWTHIFSPSLLNSASFAGGHRDGENQAPAGDRAKIPVILVTGLNRFGPGFTGGWLGPTYEWRDLLSWNRGNHNLQFGYEYQRTLDLTPWRAAASQPTFVFGNLLDFAQDKPFSQSGPGMDPRTGQVRGAFTKDGQPYHSAFIQDDWKVRKGFTLNLGLRYSDYGHLLRYTSDSDPVAYFTPGPGNGFPERIASGGLVDRRIGGDIVAALNRLWGISPRFGFAWDVFGNGKTSLRGGYGMFQDRIPHNWAVIFGGLPFTVAPTLSIFEGGPITYGFGNAEGTGWPVPPIKFELDEKGGLKGTRASVKGLEPVIHPPTIHNFMLSIQRQLAGDTILEINYSGAGSSHLPTHTNVNRFPGDLVINNGRLTRLNSSFSAITYARTNANSFGHAGSIMIEKRFARGFSGRGIYTYAKTLDYFSTTGLPQARIPETLIIDATNLGRQRGRADFDARHRFVFDSVWELPTRGQAWYSKLLGGWRLATIGVLQSGLPFTVITTAPFPVGDFNADGERYDVPNAPAFGNSLSGLSRRDYQQGLFRAADFPRPIAGQNGNLGRNTFSNPGFTTVDLNIIRPWRIPWLTSEGASLEIRAEFLNLLNHVILTPVINDMANPLFGRSTNSILPRRTVLGLRIEY